MRARILVSNKVSAGSFSVTGTDPVDLSGRSAAGSVPVEDDHARRGGYFRWFNVAASAGHILHIVWKLVVFVGKTLVNAAFPGFCS